MGVSDLSPAHLATKVALQNDRRDVNNLWNDALRSYSKTTGKTFEPTFANVAEIERYGLQQLNSFHEYRHDGTKVAKIRGLLMENISFIEAGAQQIVAATTTAFPPAVAIGTAFAFMIAGCKGVSGDYDLITAFFEDMKIFLQQVSILETRLPQHRAYQARLVDVFTATLTMCGIATKCIKLGRFKKWIINSFMGQDPDLASGRKNMTNTLANLQSATEFAILANTEDLLSGQQKLQQMQEEIAQNQKLQQELAMSQMSMLQAVSEEQQHARMGIDSIRSDIKQMFDFLKQSQTVAPSNSVSQSIATSGANRIKSICSANFENDLCLQNLQAAHIESTCQWLFEDGKWKTWFQSEHFEQLVLSGQHGYGKSHLAYAALQHLKNVASQDLNGRTIVAYFFIRENVQSLQTWRSFVRTLMLQISEQSLVLRQLIETQLSKDGCPLDDDDFLMNQVVLPLFETGSEHKLYVVVDELTLASENQTLFKKLTECFNDIWLGHDFKRIPVKFIVTVDESQKWTLVKHRYQLHKSGNRVKIMGTKARETVQAVISDRLNRKEELYVGLASLDSIVKQLVAQEIGAKANQPLFAEQMIRYLSGIGTHRAILKELSRGLPPDTAAIHDVMFQVCEYRTPANLIKPVKMLLSWMSCRMEPLTLNEANTIVCMAANSDIDVEDEIVGILSNFISVQPRDPQSEKVAENTVIQDKLDLQTLIDLRSDDNLVVVFKQSSFLQYFRGPETSTKQTTISLRTELRRSRVSVFLDCCKLLSVESEHFARYSGSRLQDYALKHCLHHWREIPLSYLQQAPEQALEVFESFFGLFRDRRSLASLIESGVSKFGDTPPKILDLVEYSGDMSDFWGSTLFVSEYNKYGQMLKAGQSDLAVRLTDHARTYWGGNDSSVFQPLAHNHLENWLMAIDVMSARRAYAAARRTIAEMRRDLTFKCNNDFAAFLDEPESNNFFEHNQADFTAEIYRLRDLIETPVSSNTCFATAVILLAIGNFTEALKEIQQAITLCQDNEEMVRNHMYQANIHYRTFMTTNSDTQELSGRQVIGYIDAALELATDSSTVLLAEALFKKAHILERLVTETDTAKQEAVDMYKKLRTLRPALKFHGKSFLWSEWNFYIQHGDDKGLLETFLSISPLQRLSTIVEGYAMAGLYHTRLLRAARLTSQTDVLLEAYYEIVTGLDIDASSALWRHYLAELYWRVRDDSDVALSFLNKTLDNTVKDQVYGLTSTDAGFIAIQHINMATDLLYQQYRKYKDFDQKTFILQEVKNLLSKPLPQSIQLNTTSTVPHLVTMAKMSKKSGLLQDFQKYLQQASDICWANLHDDLVGNDSLTLRYFTRVIAEMAGMERHARILSSAQFYYVGRLERLEGPKTDAKEEHKTDGLKIANGEPNGQPATEVHVSQSIPYSTCYNLIHSDKYKTSGVIDMAQVSCTNVFCTTEWTSWEHDGEIRSMYTCLMCPLSILCQECYELAMKRRKEPDESNPVVDFCCEDGKYLKSPIEGWKGIRDGVIEIDDEPPMDFEAFLEELGDQWKAGWYEFWVG